MLSKAQQRHYPALTIAAYTIFFGGLAMFPLTPAELAGWRWEAVGTLPWVAFAYLAVFSTAVAYGVWQWGISRIGTARVLGHQYVITLTGVVSGVVLLGEAFGLIRLLGTVVLLLGVYVARHQ